MHLSHREYYRDRDTEYELCQDFPGDEILIDGLHSMQSHFYNNGVNIEIPIVRVMNTAHWLAAYMFSTECSGDQMEYEALASISCGRDKKLAVVAMIVLAAMLKRTKGFRAMQCRNVILDNRSPDFEEGVTLYDRFLRSAEERFAEEDFLIDIPALVQRNQELEYENIQLKTENRNLKCKYEFMENQQNIQYNIGTQNNYNGCTINQYYYPTSTANPPEDVEPEPAEPEPQPEPKSPKDIWGIPQKGKYNQVREYMKARKKGDPEFRKYCQNHSLREICAYLTDEFGWDVDEHSLGANLNRNRSNF